MSETIADILREMRIFRCRNLESGELELCISTAHYFADRIEAAHKREKGNNICFNEMVRLRKALMGIYEQLSRAVAIGDLDFLKVQLDFAYSILRDVGLNVKRPNSIGEDLSTRRGC